MLPGPVYLDDSDDGDCKPHITKVEQHEISDEDLIPASQEDDLVFVGEERPAVTKCKECGSRLFAFSAAAHMKFHEESKKHNAKRTGQRDRVHIKKGKHR